MSLRLKPASSADLSAIATKFLDHVEAHAAFIRERSAAGWRFDLTMFLTTNRKWGAFRVPPETMRRLANLDIPITWQVAFASRDEEFHVEAD